MSSIYKDGDIITILTGKFTGYKGVIDKQITHSGYYLINPMVQDRIVKMNLVLHSNEIIRGC